jgi:hypothetical protein
MLAGTPAENRGGAFSGGEGRRGGENVPPMGSKEKPVSAGRDGGGGEHGAEAGGSRCRPRREEGSNSEIE